MSEKVDTGDTKGLPKIRIPPLRECVSCHYKPIPSGRDCPNCGRGALGEPSSEPNTSGKSARSLTETDDWL